MLVTMVTWLAAFGLHIHTSPSTVFHDNLLLLLLYMPLNVLKNSSHSELLSSRYVCGKKSPIVLILK